MINAYVVMILLLVVSVLFIYYSVVRSIQENTKPNLNSFERVRIAEIQEELDAGRLNEKESQQLILDVRLESESNTHLVKRFLQSNIRFERCVFVGIVTIAVIGSVSLYERLGYAKEVVFSEAVEANLQTQQQVRNFLTYRAQRYDRVQDWYYQATDFFNAGEYQNAVISFEKALAKLPEEAEGRTNLLVEYAQAVLYANDKKSSPKMQKIVDSVLTSEPNHPVALQLKGLSEFDQGNYLGAVLTWQRAIRFNPNSSERIALLYAITNARQIGQIGYQQVPLIITHQLSVKLEWDTNNTKWKSTDILLVYAVPKGQKMPVAIQRVTPSQLSQPILLTNLDSLMPTATLGETEKVDVIVKLANINDADLTKGRIIGKKDDLLTNRKEIFTIKLGL